MKKIKNSKLAPQNNSSVENNSATPAEVGTQPNNSQVPLGTSESNTASNDNNTTAATVAAEENQVTEPALTAEESQLLAQHEQTIKAGFNTFTEVGKALAEINEKRLYRAEYKTFKAYCLKKWDIAPAHAYRLIKATHTLGELYPTGDKPESLKETHLRLLKGLSHDEALQCIAEAQKNGKDGVITLANIKKAVNAIRPAKERQTRSKEAKSEGSETSQDSTADNQLITSVLEEVRKALKQVETSKSVTDALAALKSIEKMLSTKINGSSSVTASIDVTHMEQELPKAA